jgi:hypothetical protein
MRHDLDHDAGRRRANASRSGSPRAIKRSRSSTTPSNANVKIATDQRKKRSRAAASSPPANLAL